MRIFYKRDGTGDWMEQCSCGVGINRLTKVHWHYNDDFGVGRGGGRLMQSCLIQQCIP